MSVEDISRFLFQPRKRYSGVRMQQGRVWLDSDWNEDEHLHSEELRQILLDIICAKGSANQGFQVLESTLQAPVEVNLPDGNTVETYDFALADGRFYLGGLGFSASSGTAAPERLLRQSDWLQIDAAAANLPTLPTLTGTQVRYDLVYLKGWEQCVTAIEDRELREPALGGPDTSVRVRRMRRVEVLTDVGDSCSAAITTLQQRLTAALTPSPATSPQFDDASGELLSPARLTVDFIPDGVPADPCTPAVEQGYIGADNQTIRVQLIAPNRFVWSRDNAARFYRVKVKDIAGVTNGDRRQIEFLNLPADAMAYPLAGQVVRLCPWGAWLPNQEKVADLQGEFFTVESGYDPAAQSLTLTTPVPAEWLTWLADHVAAYGSNRDGDDQQYLYLHLWTGGEAQTFTPGTAVPLSGTGLSVQFSDYGLPGDYWIISARPNTPSQVVPWRLMKAAPPMGPKLFFAPLALIRWNVDTSGTLQAAVRDCRERFQPLCEVGGCCTVTVGDGRTSRGLFNSLEDAIAFLPPEGGKICLLPGRHQANVTLNNRQRIHIVGCGEQTLVQPRPNQAGQPIFRLNGCQQIRLEQMTLVALAGTAIQVVDTAIAQQPSQGIHMVENRIVACIHAIEIRVNNTQAGNKDIRIAYNHIAQLDKPNEVDGKATVFAIADDVVIEHNRLVVVPAPDPNDPNDPRDPDDVTDNPFDPCREAQIFLDLNFPLQTWVVQIFRYIVQRLYFGPRPYQALGGIQIGGGSERVIIRNNHIIGGRGNGITLGHMPTVRDVADFAVNEEPFFRGQFTEASRAFLREEFDSTLYDITLAENTIQAMGLSGIGVVMFINLQIMGLMVQVFNLTIHRNQISHCLQQPPAALPREQERNFGLGGISLAAVEVLHISENRIERNGLNYLTPTCGIFILLGQGVNIRDNHILDNGPFVPDLNLPAQRGLRGGIVVACLSSRVILPATSANPLPPNLGVGDVVAAKIHGNTVSQPLSQALIVLAVGPVMITDNSLAAQDIDLNANPFALFSGAVLVVNLGLPIQDLLGLIGSAVLSAKDLRYQAAPVTGNVQESGGSFTVAPTFNRTNLLFWPSGNTLFSDNQVVFDLREVNGRTVDIDGAVSAVFIGSRDDVGCCGNQSDCNFLIDLLITNIFVIGFTARVTDNRCKEGFLTLLSIFSWSFKNITAHNQCTHCIVAPGTLDINANQIIDSRSCEIFQSLIT